MRDSDTVIHGHAADRYEWQHISSAHAGVRASVRTHVNQLRCLRDSSECCVSHAFRRCNEGDNGAVGLATHVDVEHLGALNR